MTDPIAPRVLAAEPERLAYSIHEAANLLGVDYFSVYRLIQRGKLRACSALRGKLLVPRAELLRLLNPHAADPNRGRRRAPSNN